jgi:hypothetical protein
MRIDNCGRFNHAGDWTVYLPAAVGYTMGAGDSLSIWGMLCRTWFL